MSQLPILPVLIPMLGAIASLFVEHRRYGRRTRRTVAWLTLAALAAAVAALWQATADGRILVYLLGDWPARLGIALTADRLSAWMLITTVLLAAPCLLAACAGWDRRAPHFHALFQFQLMGLNGAFLTGDIFNLFVFFEVLLIASYGLLLSGGRGLRLRIGLHYVVFNVVASSLFLIALGLLYGLLGSLNMAELALRLAALPASELPLARAVIGLLLLVFCAKAALLPLHLWLPEAYARAPAAVAALFVIMTKVGLYAVLRLSTLWLGAGAGALAGFGRQGLLWAAIATLAVAALGALAAVRLRVLVAWGVVFSAGTLATAFAIGNAGSLAAGLYYLPHSCFAAAALFLIADLVRRRRGAAGDHKTVVAALPGRALPGTLFMLAAIALAGLPPLSGFIGKAALLAAVPAADTTAVWTALLGGSLLLVVAFTRGGIRLFWRMPEGYDPQAAPAPPPRITETVATVWLLGYLLAMTVAAGPLLRQTTAIAEQLLQPQAYTDAVRLLPPHRRQP